MVPVFLNIIDLLSFQKKNRETRGLTTATRTREHKHTMMHYLAVSVPVFLVL